MSETDDIMAQIKAAAKKQQEMGKQKQPQSVTQQPVVQQQQRSEIFQMDGWK